MVGPEVVERMDAMLDVGLATTLAGLSLVALVFLMSRVQQIEVEAGTIRAKRSGSDVYAQALSREARRLRGAARLVVFAAVACFTSAILMLAYFDTFGEVDLLAPGATQTDQALAAWDVGLTGIPFLFGLASLLAATLALGWDWVTRG